jgi:D-arabinose 1-dehydrogenase-like Zn-dependent alcohol dehydrogenase
MYAPLKERCAGAGTRVGIVGLGGLGVMGVKLAKAIGCAVTVISRGETKRDLALRSGADSYVASRDDEQMVAWADHLDLILNTIPTEHDPSVFASLLTPTGEQVHVGLHATAITAGAVNLFLPGRTRERFTFVSGVASTQEVMDLCAREKIYTEIDIRSVAYLNRIFELLSSSNESGKRFVLDIAGTLATSVTTAPPTRLQPHRSSCALLRDVADGLAESLLPIKAASKPEETVQLPSG